MGGVQLSASSFVSRRFWYLLVGLAFAVHNGEEALAAGRLIHVMQSRAPAFLREFYAGITVRELQVNLLILTLIGILLSSIAVRFPNARAAAYAILVFGTLLGLNAIVHIALTVAFQTYVPGLVTAVLLTLPVAVALIVRACREHWVASSAFWVVVPAAFLIHKPILGVFLRSTIAMMRSG